MTTAFEPRPHTAAAPREPDPHGPGTPGSRRPGERGSVLIVTRHPDPDEAMRHAMAWITAFEEDCGLVLDTDETALYAVGRAGDLGEALRRGPLVHEDGSPADTSAFVDAVLADGTWRLRDADPRAWSTTYRATILGAAPEAVCTIWDVFPLPAA